MFSIGEFSKITGLSVKTLRFYHEQGLLEPSYVDRDTGYRYYDQRQIETARAIAELRGLEFSLAEIQQILQLTGDQEFVAALEQHRAELEQKIKAFRAVARSLDKFIQQQREAIMSTGSAHVEERLVEPVLVAAIRMQGRYGDCGTGFARLGRSFGRHICGKPIMLHHDREYHEDDANFEVCMPIRRRAAADGIEVRELPGGRCLSLVHKGPYDQLGPAYAKLLTYARERGYQIVMPTREVYLKGPGMIFRGNPKNYLTEIQMLIEPAVE